jgi:hypothetical protein
MVKNVFGKGSFADVETQIKRGKAKKPFPDWDDVNRVAKREGGTRRR